MEPIMHVATSAAVALAMAAAGCRLDPLVTDNPGASAHVLPAGAPVPSAADNPELANQINVNDGVDDKALVASGAIPRGSGASNGMPVKYWSFGAASRAPSPLYKFVARTEAGALTPVGHPPLVDALPGDPGYSSVHTINQVVVTADYAGQLITTASALADAVELGLVEEPVPTGTFAASPIVLPGTPLDVGGATVMPETVYGRGYVVGMFEFGGMLGVQPGGALLPTRQVSFLREVGTAIYDAAHPIFEATIPTTAPNTTANYTPLSIVVNVDVQPGTASSITNDDQLFTRTMGTITGTGNAVVQFQITTAILMLQLQFAEGAP
jgi:hypothetical protein